MTPQRAAAPVNDEGGHDPVGYRSPVSVVADTTIVGALDRIAAEMAEQRDALKNIAMNVDYVVRYGLAVRQ